MSRSDSRFLLDTNVLIALLDPNHAFHAACDAWMASIKGNQWGTCPIVENGVVRVLSGQSYPSGPRTPAEAFGWLDRALQFPGHFFVPDDVRIFDSNLVRRELIRGPKQVTDAYLLGLCRKHGLRLATTDRKIATELAPGEDLVEVI